jgi:signal transduction histidine kinase/CheY-like chemotaxis protein
MFGFDARLVSIPSATKALTSMDDDLVQRIEELETRLTELNLDAESEKRYSSYLTALHETALGLIRRLNLDELLKDIIERAGRLGNTPHGYIYLYEPQSDELVLCHGMGEYRKSFGYRVKPGQGITGQVWQTGKTMFVEDYRNWADRIRDRRFADLHSVVGFPLTSESQVTGVIGLGYFGRKAFLDRDLIRVLSRFAELAAIALDNARLYTQLKEELSERQRLEKQLIQAQKMEAIGTLAAGIAHDFNNLMMAIQGRTSLMLGDIDPSHPFHEPLKGIEAHLRNATDLTRRLLGFARGGKYEVRSIHVNDVIREQNRLFGRTRKEITIEETLAPSLWTVKADQSQIEQVLLNLYINAWQAMPSGGTLRIRTENKVFDEDQVRPHQARAGEYVVISVSDTGIGMDAETQRRIFEPFFTTKEMGHGNGLGLASVYGIVRNHDGFIRVQSRPNRGTSFMICIPAQRRTVAVERKSNTELVRGGGTVLLVDDEPMILEIGKMMLQRLGFEVQTACGGEEALQVFKVDPARIALVILDMIMPDLSGGETFDRLKAIRPEVKVLLSSGYSIDGEAAGILERGCSGFIQKPFDIQALSMKIRQILGETIDEGSQGER